MMRTSLLCGVALVLLASGCARVQQAGDYAFVAEEIIRDTCQLLPDPEALWGGRLTFSGELVRMEYELFEMELRGAYKETVQSFYLDGSAVNVSGEVDGQTCQFDLVALHLEADSESPTVFKGTMRLDYQSAQRERCNCELWLSYRAVRTGG